MHSRVELLSTRTSSPRVNLRTTHRTVQHRGIRQTHRYRNFCFDWVKLLYTNKRWNGLGTVAMLVDLSTERLKRKMIRSEAHLTAGQSLDPDLIRPYVMIVMWNQGEWKGRAQKAVDHCQCGGRQMIISGYTSRVLGHQH